LCGGPAPAPVFFFSSRRRHTRLQGNWSSDVCSSDLGPAPSVAAFGARALLDLTPLALEGKTPWPAWLAPHQVPAAERLIRILGRSEERRVGKEGRSRWSARH